MAVRDRNGSSAADLTAPATQTVKAIVDAGIRQAITTSYRGPTDSRGSRVIARCDAMRITVPWDHALDPQANHAAAALQLATRLGWHARNHLVGGAIADGYVFVLTPIVTAPWPEWLTESVLSMEHDHAPSVRYYGNRLRRFMDGK